MADIIQRAIPETFASSETIESDEFGSLPVKKAKGEGGMSDLATRLGNNYYNDYLRYVLGVVNSALDVKRNHFCLNFVAWVNSVTVDSRHFCQYKNLDSF